MNTQSNAMSESPLESHVVAPAVISATRRMCWSVRRELWENRSRRNHPLARPGRGPEYGRIAARRARPQNIRSREVDSLCARCGEAPAPKTSA